jgi:MYXO-CTERM domain-containing protein
MRASRFVQLGCFAAVIGMGAPEALGGGFSYETFFVSAKTPTGQGFFLLTIDQGDYDPATGTYDWSAGQEIEVRDVFTNELLATIMEAEIHYSLGGPAGANPGPPSGPTVNLNFAVQADDELTDITVTSALLSFDGIDNAEGRASAGITVTDVLGDGATMTGLHDDGNMYSAQYNGLAPGGTQFTSFFDTLEALPFGSNSTSSEFPGGSGFEPIGETVMDMSSQFSFSLTPFDIASGTSTWELLPAPGTLALLLVGGLVGTRRRRG